MFIHNKLHVSITLGQAWDKNGTGQKKRDLYRKFAPKKTAVWRNAPGRPLRYNSLA